MFWKIMFWLTFMLLVLPFPFKLAEMISGKDQRAFAVKFEEMANAVFLSIGLIAFWQFAYSMGTSSHPLFWYLWLGIAIIWSIVAMFKSAKLGYGVEQVGKKATVIMACFSTLFFLPMLVAVFRYAG